jgi:hypothetical protein|tara:strand:+ start:354 stop:629 length:276 start_codon:yes stop_codon:yes gene_type:complete
MDKPLFEIDVDISDYNLMALNDTVRMLLIQVVVQVLFVLRNPQVELLSSIFIENTLFIILGIMVYWLIFNHVITFKNKNNTDIFYQKIYTK